MNNREMLITFIKEVIKENNGIYNWSWCPHSDDYEHELEVETNPDLWREKMLRNNWMVNNPIWNVYGIGMHQVNDDGKVKFTEDLTILVDKKKSLSEFVKNYKGKLECPIYLEWIDVLGVDGGHYEDIDEPDGPFEFLFEEYQIMDEPNKCQTRCHTDGDTDEKSMAYYQEIADSIVI